MTESEWAVCGEPEPMLHRLGRGAGERKLRLFACACVRRIGPLLDAHASRKALDVAEGRVGAEGLEAARVAAEEHATTPAGSAAAALVQDWPAWDVAWDAALFAAHAVSEGDPASAAWGESRRPQADLIREIFGDPFLPAERAPAWRTPGVVALARAIDEGDDYGRMPELADALAHAGCTHDDLLAHCRGPNAHVRGCWAVDTVLTEG